MKTVNLESWRGPRDTEALDPAKVEFTARHSPKTCAGCVFAGQWAKVCNIAAEQAKLRGLPDCDDGYVYMAVEKDPRQLSIDGA